MDASEEISQRKKPCADGEWQQHSPASMVPVSKVLDDDNLLIEILLRVSFPTTLVCAALVCKRWLCHASDPKFLSVFRKRHPPRLLGFYIYMGSAWLWLGAPLLFVPMQPQPPELAPFISRVASHSFGADNDRLCIMDCRNGSVLTRCRRGKILTHGVHRPLCAQRGMDDIPPLPRAQYHGQQIFNTILSKEEGGVLSYLYMLAEFFRKTKSFRVRVYTLQGGVWCMHASATTQLPRLLTSLEVVLVDDKIYMADTFSDEIIVLDMTTSGFSTILLPQGVSFHCVRTIMSRAGDASGVYLTHIHVKELQLCIWLHKGDNWLLVDTICLHQMWDNLRMLDQTLEDEHISFTCISNVGDNAEFVFLEMCGCIFYLDVTSKTLRKVHGVTVKDRQFNDVYPFMMIWPPIFPAPKDDPARFAILAFRWSLYSLC
ncbi:hypothetical protein ACQJBY_004079 [Aegilops geniculata]